MKKIFLTPGPAELYPTVHDHLRTALQNGIASISHRSSAFKKIYAEVDANLRELLGIPSNFQIAFLGSANEIWERIFQNMVEKTSFHFVNGAFSEGFAKFGTQLQKDVTRFTYQEGRGFDLTEGEIDENVEMAAITINETSTGAWIAPSHIANLRKRLPNALIAVDGVSILPCYPLDFSLIDTAFFSVQKAFGLPAGLGVWIFNERCVQKANFLKEKGLTIGTYHSLPELSKRAFEFQNPETPNVLAIYLLAKVTEDMLRYGKENLIRDMNYKATLLYHAAEKSSIVSPFVENQAERSPSVLVLKTEKATLLKTYLAGFNLEIGSGYGKFKDVHIRVANFPAVSKETFEMLVDKLALAEGLI